MTRLDQLLAYLADEPDDPFNIYAVALEYQKTEPEKALGFFLRLTNEHQNYIPTYYHLGKLLAELEEHEKAREVFITGIRIAEAAGDVKTVRELRNALTEIEFDL